METKFTVRMIDLPADYPVVSQWWPAHGWPAVPDAILPKLGLMVEAHGNPCMAGWLYMDNSVGVSMMEWVVSNPETAPRDVLRAVQVLVGAMKDLALSNDYGVVLTSCKQPALVRAYEKAGFQKTDEGMTHLLLLTR